MSTSQTTTKISADDLREEVRKEYAEVALDPHKGYHFHICGCPQPIQCDGVWNCWDQPKGTQTQITKVKSLRNNEAGKRTAVIEPWRL